MSKQVAGFLKRALRAPFELDAPLNQSHAGDALQCIRQYSTAIKPPAFVFDIDGVLVRGKTVLEPARRALAKLYSGDGQEPRYPVCFLTNGGGVLEAKKAEQLSDWLGVNVHADQVVLSHTPFKQLVPRLRDVPVLLAGRHNIEEVAKSYGFRKTVTTAQLAAAHPAAVPFVPRDLLPASPTTIHGTEKSPVKAILVFSDPGNWYMDLQLMTDLITSGGIMGQRELPSGQAPIEVVFSNPDRVFANEHPTPRFGQGAFAVALRAMLTQVLEHRQDRLDWKVFGKPNPEPYQLAAKVLTQQAELIGLGAASGAERAFGSIYMVGDNPASDIAGARNAGEPWRSVLVRTGVFSSSESNSKHHPADIVVEDVEQAVIAGLHRSRADRWHSFR